MAKRGGGAQLSLLEWVLVAIVLYSTSEVCRMPARPARAPTVRQVEEPGFQGLKEEHQAPPPSALETDLEFQQPGAVVPQEGVDHLYRNTLITNAAAERMAADYVRAHTAGPHHASSGPERPTVRGLFFSARNLQVLRGRLSSEGVPRVSHVALHEAQTQVYREQPGELPPLDVLGGNIPDPTELCPCRSPDPAEHVKTLNGETVRRLVAAMQRARDDARAYQAVAQAWTDPIDIPPSMKQDSKALEFPSFA